MPGSAPAVVPCLGEDVKHAWRGPALIAAIVLLAAVDIAAWALVFHRGPAESSYVSRLNPSEAPQASPSSASTPSPQPSARPGASLPDTNGRPLAATVVGDSIGAGDYTSAPERRYSTLVQDALKARGPLAFDDVSAPATTTTDITVPSDQDLIVVELGTDDLAADDLKGFTASYAALLASIRKASPDAVLVCAGTWSELGVYYDSVIQSACSFAGGQYVALQPLYLDAANRGPAGIAGPYGTSDDQAPNDAGHRAIAAALLDALDVQLP